MKKIWMLGITFLMCLSMSGCGEKTKDDIKETISDKGYKLIVDAKEDSRNYYDEKGSCYNYDGKKTDCERIIKGEGESVVLLIKGKEKLHSAIYEGSITSLSYVNSENTYTHDFKKNSKSISLMDSKNSKDWCVYNIEGKKETGLSSCKKSKKDEYKKVESDYKKFLNEIELNEEDFLSFMKEYVKDEVKAIEKKVAKKLGNQKELELSEIGEILRKNYDLNETKDGYLYVGSGDNESKIEVAYMDKKLLAIAYYDFLYTSNGMYYVYFPETLTEAGADASGTCSYDLTKGKTNESKSCSKEQIKYAGYLQEWFTFELHSKGLTLEDLSRYFTLVKPDYI